MEILGRYTAKGAALAAKIQAGTETLRITRIMGGQGNTAISALTMVAEKQPLTNIALRASDASVIIETTLTSATATQAYTLNEVGIYAKDSSGTNVLYKVYSLNPGVDINNLFNLSIKFNLVESVLLQGQVTVEAPVSGMVTPYEVDAKLSRLFLCDGGKNQTVSCAPAQLQATIDALPSMIEGDITINVSAGTLTGDLHIEDFYGSGSLNIVGAGLTSLFVTGYVIVRNCNLRRVHLSGMTINGAQQYAIAGADDPFAQKTVIYVENGGNRVEFENIEVRAPIEEPDGIMYKCCGMFCRRTKINIVNFKAQRREIWLCLEQEAEATIFVSDVGTSDAMAYAGIYALVLGKNTKAHTSFHSSTYLGARMNKVDSYSWWQPKP